LDPNKFFGPRKFLAGYVLPEGASCQTLERIVLLLLFIV